MIGYISKIFFDWNYVYPKTVRWGMKFAWNGNIIPHSPLGIIMIFNICKYLSAWSRLEFFLSFYSHGYVIPFPAKRGCWEIWNRSHIVSNSIKLIFFKCSWKFPDIDSLHMKGKCEPWSFISIVAVYITIPPEW